MTLDLSRRGFLGALAALCVAPLVPGADFFAGPHSVVRDSLLERLRALAARHGLPAERMVIEDFGDLRTAPLCDSDGREIAPSYEARHLRFALLHEPCGEWLEAMLLIDSRLLEVYIPSDQRDAFICSEAGLYFEAMVEMLTWPCPHNERVGMPRVRR